MTTGVVMIDCKNPEDHDQEPYARFYWRVKQAVKKSGFRVRGKLIGGTKHQVTLVQLCRQLLERFKS
jgi:hypothetical protein